MNLTFQDFSSTSYTFLPPATLDSLPTNSAVSPFHAPYTVSPILINFTNPDGKSGLWQAATTRYLRNYGSARSDFYTPSQLCRESRLDDVRGRERSDWENDSFRHGTACLPVSSRGEEFASIELHSTKSAPAGPPLCDRSHCIRSVSSTLRSSRRRKRFASWGNWEKLA